ncbi:MAG: hypothetical protein ACERIH_12320 [Labilibaculum antarcticum]
MKRLSLYLLLVCFAVFATQTSFAQKEKEKDEKHEVHVKVKVIEDGKETIIDTVFYESAGHDKMIEMMEMKGMSDSLMKKHHIWISDEGDHKGKHKRIIKKIHVTSDGDYEIDEDVDVEIMKKMKFSDEDGDVFIHSGDSCIKKDIRIEMLHGGGHKMHMIDSHGKKGEKIIIINDSDDVEITEEDGYKIIKIKTSGDDKVWIEKDSDVEVTVEVDDQNGKKVKKIKRKKKKE